MLIRRENGLGDGEREAMVPAGRPPAALVDVGPLALGGGDGNHDIDIHFGYQVHVSQVVGGHDRDFQRTVLHGWVLVSVGVD